MRPDEHIAVAQRNEAFSASLDLAKSDWAMTALFYAAVHYINSYLVRTLPPPKDHKEREEFMQRVRVFRDAWGAYRLLKDFGSEARYGGQLFTQAELVAAREALARLKAVCVPPPQAPAAPVVA